MRLVRLCTYILTIALLFSGCAGGWMNGSYTSVTPHREAPGQQKPEDADPVSDYETLRAVLLRYVQERTQKATLNVSQYGDTLEQDVEDVIQKLFSEEPIVSYAVRWIQVIPAEIGARRIATVNISYQRTREQMQGIQNTWGLDSMNRRLGEALESADTELTLLVIGYQNADFSQMVETYYKQHPDTVMECPEVSVSVYPEKGTTRILEINLRYSLDRQTLLDMAREVQIMLSSAEGYVRSQEEEETRAERLDSFLRALLTQEGESSTPVYSLLHDGVYTSRTVAEVYRMLCERVGLECHVVEGYLEGERWFWNILRLDGVCYHTDLTMLWPEGELRFDDEMTGYEWKTGMYPDCVRPGMEDPPEETHSNDPNEDQPPEESTVPEESTAPEETEPEITVPEPTEPQEP